MEKVKEKKYTHKFQKNLIYKGKNHEYYHKGKSPKDAEDQAGA